MIDSLLLPGQNEGLAPMYEIRLEAILLSDSELTPCQRGLTCTHWLRYDQVFRDRG
jgi:hypothetical protein